MTQTQLINHDGHIRAHAGNDVEYPIADISNILPDDDRNRYGNLFAAAPDMLKILEEAEEHSQKRLPVKKSTWLKMVSAIKKARGKTCVNYQKLYRCVDCKKYSSCKHSGFAFFECYVD